MKEEFLALVKKIKETGIANILSDVTTAKELTAAWQKFKAENGQLFTDCYAWADEYAKDGYKELFPVDEGFGDPTEIVICIYIASRKDDEIHEGKVFSDYEDLTHALRDVGGNFTDVLANFIEGDYISSITAEGLFCSDEDEDEESDDADEETGDEEEDSEDGAEENATEESDDADEETGDEEEDSEDGAEENATEESDDADEETGNEEDSEDVEEDDDAEGSDADN